MPAIFFGVPAPNLSSVRRTFCSSASPRGRNASLLRCLVPDDRAPPLPNSIGDSLLPSLIPRVRHEGLRFNPIAASVPWKARTRRCKNDSRNQPARRAAAAQSTRLPQQLRTGSDSDSIQTTPSPTLVTLAVPVFGSTGTTRTPDTTDEVHYTRSARPGSAWCRVEGNPCSESEANAQRLSTDDSGGECSSPCWRWDRNRVAPANFTVIGRTRTPPRPSLRRAATRAGGSMRSRSNLLRCRDLQIPTTLSSRRRRPMTPRRKLSRPCPSGPTTG